MTTQNNRRYTLLQTEDPAAACRWLRDRLYFTQEQNGDLVNGDCVLRLRRGPASPVKTPPGNAYYTGLAHVALAAADIDEALACCRGLDLQTDEGVSFLNLGVFGQGERYFNIFSPFGVVFEVAHRVSTLYGRRPTPVFGLDHIGLPCTDLGVAMTELGAAGFKPLFSPVENKSETDGSVRCCMLADGYLTVETYQFLDKTPLPMPENAPLRGVGDYSVRSAPGGLRMIAGDEAL
jgi:hypothetical protein